jgi:hypothetical protein
MAISNFLFGPAAPNSRSGSFSATNGTLGVLIFAAVLTLTACESLTRRSPPGAGHAQPGKIVRATPTPFPSSGSTPLPAASPMPENTPVGSAQAAPPPQPPLSPPTPSAKDLVKVGIILGPGGMKAYAHLGVLREFERARIHVQSLVGLEWGSMIGALYAMQGQVNDAEWKAFRLQESELPSSGILSSSIEPRSVSALAGFLDSVMPGVVAEKSRVDFACASVSEKGEKTNFLNRGSLKDAMMKCVPYPPLYTANAGLIASPFSVDEAAAWLRARGANLIVLVNVLGQGEYLPNRTSNSGVENLLWSEIRREMLRAKSPAVNYVINVNTTGHPLTDFEGRRALMDIGQRAAADVVNKMVSQYGF